MPTEIRQLIFSRAELADAIAAHSRVAPGGVPAGRVILVQVAEDPEVHVLAKVVRDDRAELDTVRLDARFVGAALIHYCLGRRIPIPQAAEKRLQAIGDSVGLSLTISATEARIPSFA